MVVFEYISFFLMVFTSLVGIFSLVHMITEWMFDDIQEFRAVSFLQLKDSDDKTELLLRSYFKNNAGKIVIVDEGLDEAMLQLIEVAKGTRNNIIVIKQDELQNVISKVFIE